MLRVLVRLSRLGLTPLRFERSDEFAFGTDLVSFRALYRTDGKLADTNAIKTYQTAAS